MMRKMRTTVTLDPDVEAMVKRAMTDRGVTFKEAINDAIRQGHAAEGPDAAPHLPVYAMGAPRVDVTKALRLAAHLEDDEIASQLSRGA